MSSTNLALVSLLLLLTSNGTISTTQMFLLFALLTMSGLNCNQTTTQTT